MTLEIYHDGAQVSVTSGAVDVFDGSGAKVVDAGAVVVDSDGAATYALLAAIVPTTEAFSSTWREEWTLIIDGTAHVFVRGAHLVRRLLWPVATERDLLRRHSELKHLIPCDRVSWQHSLDEAWDVMIDMLIEDGRRPYSFVSNESLRRRQIFKALEIAFRELSPNSNGRYKDLADFYASAFETAWATLQVDQDTDQDGDVDERQSGSAVLVTSAGPMRRRRTGVRR